VRFSIKKLIISLIPVTILLLVLTFGLRMVQSETMQSTAETDTALLATPVAPQSEVADSVLPDSVMIEAKLDPETDIAPAPDDAGESAADKEAVWEQITDAMFGLNDIAGADLIVDVQRGEKGALEVALNKDDWDRVRYQTRADLKTDISNLWHLYVLEYGYVESSVVYFTDVGGKVIDIFSKVR